MRALLVTCCFAVSAAAFAADEKQPEPRHAVLVFGDDLRKFPKSWEMTLEMTTASGAVYELRIDDKKIENARSHAVQRDLMQANWMSNTDRDSYNLAIYGVRTKDGKADAVKSLVLTNRLVQGQGQFPHLEAVGGIRVETREADPKSKPDPARKPLPAGPDFGKEPCIEFDFSTLPPGMKDLYWNFTMKVHVEGREDAHKKVFEVVSDFSKDAGACRVLTNSYNESGYKAELVGKTTIRVYGLSYKDRFYPAVKGEITSPDLKPNELPKITNPKRL